ncbi:MAG: hypothetical protein AAF871_00970 [Pseudomonadota bacterium]
MSDELWADIIARITPNRPHDMDQGKTGPKPKPLELVGPPGPVAPEMWRRAGNQTYVGIRVRSAPGDPGPLALRLASMAIERQVIPVILSYVDMSGFEQFGFRVERLLAEPADLAEELEAELQAFWDLAMVIDLGDVTLLA